jgi:cyclopropane fatty-acyl-phospholipid synthase-like methyltransferase
MPENHFGERVAERYDERYAYMEDAAVVDPIVDLLTNLAGDGAALELGVGTGRIALPLARRGVPVHGIDLWRQWSRDCRRRLGPSRSS